MAEGGMCEAESRSKYPLHWMVWFNESPKLRSALTIDKNDLEVRDVRGRTPLMLAVTLGHLESVKVLLDAGANANVEDRNGYTPTHEAVSSGDPELVTQVLQARDMHKYQTSVAAIPDLLRKIRDTADFYVEMKWEFTSWLPLLSRVCPSDTYRVFKSGSNVRIDTTLLGFEHSSWQRGNRSYIFKGEENSASLFEVNHDACQVHAEIMQVSAPSETGRLAMTLAPDAENVAARLTSPVVCTYVDTEKIQFERNRSGMLGWRSDRSELVNGYEAKVYTASNVEFVTKTRVEHLSEEDKKRHKNSQSPLQSLLGTLTEEKIVATGKQEEDVIESRGNPCHIKAEEYFDESVLLGKRDIGRPRESAIRVQRFKATIWLCDTYPLSLAEQVLPIVDLMSLNSSHFAKLRSFITLKLPTGFPIKIEIPLFHVLNARITFGNINASENGVPGVETKLDNDMPKCTIDSSVFEIPRGYTKIGGPSQFHGSTSGGARAARSNFYGEEDDQLLQYAIEQSLVEAGSLEDKVTVWEALNSPAPRYLEANGNVANKSKQMNSNGNMEKCTENTEDAMLLRALEESVRVQNGGPNSHPVVFRVDESDEQLSLALKLSRELREEEERQIKEEEDMMNRILELSLSEQ